MGPKSEEEPAALPEGNAEVEHGRERGGQASSASGGLFDKDLGTATERLHFVLEKKGQPIRARLMNPAAVFAVSMVTLWGLSLVGSYVRMRTILVICIAAIIVGTVFSKLRGRFKQRRGREVDFHFSTDEELRGSRLIAGGHRDVLSSLAEIKDEPFEPVIVEVATSKLSFATAFAAAIVISPLAGWIFRSGSVWTSNLGYPVAAFALWARARFRPVYYRIVPWRLDIMSGVFIGNQIKLIRSVDLRSATIRLMGKERCLMINIAGQKKPLEIHHDLTSEPMPLVEAVFRGALCTSPAPPLPDDALLG